VNVDDYYTDAFRRASHEVLTEMGLDETRLSDSPQGEDGFELLATVGITGAIIGHLTVHADAPSAVGLSRVLSETIGEAYAPADTLQEFERSAFAEVANQVAGRGVMKLSEAHRDCDITPPTVICGRHVEHSHLNLPVENRWVCTGTYGLVEFVMGYKAHENADPNC
jgi:CheY-specific phosphatase CheX